MKRWIKLAIFLLVLAAAGAGVFQMNRVRAVADLPAAPARKGDFLVIVRCRGELKARRSVQISAPFNVPELRLVWQAPPGGKVEKDEVVIRFDPSSAQQQLKERESALSQAQAALDQAIAQGRITAEQDKRDLAKTKYEVERAKLQVSKAEIESKLKGEEMRIDLSIAERNLKVQEATVELHQAADRSKVAALERARDLAKTQVEITQRRLERMEVRTPLSGVIIYMPNYSQGWMNAKPFKVGDMAWPGAGMAEIPDLSTLEMEAKIEEIDRGKIALGQDVRVKVDALPELKLEAKLTGVSPLTEQTFEWPPVSSFRGYAKIEQPDSRLRPAMNGSMDVVVNRIPQAISIPAKALFTRHGKPIVWVKENGDYRPVEVEVLARNPDEVAVKGIQEGAMVALREPEKTT